MQQLFASLEASGFARAVGESPSLTAGLSALHVLGFTLVMSAGMAWSLRASGLLLAAAPVASIARPASRLLVVGLAVSLLTGFALFAPRATSTAVNGVFQLKLVLLLLAAITQLLFNAKALGPSGLSVGRLRAGGVSGLVLWLSLAVTACWFILFE